MDDQQRIERLTCALVVAQGELATARGVDRSRRAIVNTVLEEEEQRAQLNGRRFPDWLEAFDYFEVRP